MAYYSESGDYFVENHDGHGRYYRGSLEEEKQQTQGNIGKGLSRLASDEYRIDIVHHMAKMEVKSLVESHSCILLIIQVVCNARRCHVH